MDSSPRLLKVAYKDNMKIVQKICASVLVCIVLVVPMLVFANPPASGGNAPSGLPNPLGAQNGTIYDFVKAILGIFLKIGIFISAGAFVYSGFLFVKAQGNSTGREEASNAFLNTVIGTALLLGAWGLSQIIKLTIDGILG